MQKVSKKIAISVAVFLLFCGLCIGFATVNDQLNIFGDISFGSRGDMLEPGPELNQKIIDCGAEKIIFDSFMNQSALLSYEGITWDDGVPVQSEDSTPDSIKLFYLENQKNAYILSKEDNELFANPDSSDLFFANGSESTVKEIVFYSFNTSRVTDMSGMFNGCDKLTAVYAFTEFNTAAVENSDAMFTGCYLLVGGEGTRVYPVGASETDQPLDVTNARVDGQNGQDGYFTDLSAIITYFRSNELKEASAQACYEIKGTGTWFSLSNAIDKITYSAVDMKYSIATYYHNGEDWVMLDTKLHLFAGGRYNVERFAISMPDAEKNRIKVVATCLSGQIESIEAEFVFDASCFSREYSYNAGAICLMVYTNTDGGEFSFAWDERVIADNSDVNLIFTGVDSQTKTKKATLDNYTQYTFYFFITDEALLGDIENGSALIEELVTVEKK